MYNKFEKSEKSDKLAKIRKYKKFKQIREVWKLLKSKHTVKLKDWNKGSYSLPCINPLEIFKKKI